MADLAAIVEDARDLRFDHPVDVEFLTPEEYPDLATEDPDDLDDAVIDEPRPQRGASGARRRIGRDRPGRGVQPGERRRHPRLLRPGRPSGSGCGARRCRSGCGPPSSTSSPTRPGPGASTSSTCCRRTSTTGPSPARAPWPRGMPSASSAATCSTSLTDAERAAYEEEYAGELRGQHRGHRRGAGLPLGRASPSRTGLGAPLVHLLEATDGNDGVDEAFDPAAEHRGAPVRPGRLPRRGGVRGTTAGPRRRRGRGGGRPRQPHLVPRAGPAHRPRAGVRGRAAGGAATSTRSTSGTTAPASAPCSRGDTEADEREMAAALEAWADAMPGGQAHAISVPGHPTLDACDPGARSTSACATSRSDLLELALGLRRRSRRRRRRSCPSPRRGASPAPCSTASRSSSLADPEQPGGAWWRRIEANSPAARQRCGSGDR